MWALRRASNPLRNQALCTITLRASCDSLDRAGFSELPTEASVRSPFLKRFSSGSNGAHRNFVGKLSFSSQAGTRSSGEEELDLEDGFSELEAANADLNQGSNGEHESDDDVISDVELSEGEDNDISVEGPQNELELSDDEIGGMSETIPQNKKLHLALLKAIMDAPGLSVENVLKKWVEEGNIISRTDISLIMLGLRKRRLFGKALQFSEWLESSKQVEFLERDYAPRVDLIAKVRGLQKAESYVEKIPKSFRGEVIYRTLLANFVYTTNVKKAEQTFNKMKELQFPITAFACNQLLLLYKRVDKRKIGDVLLLMEKENVKPTIFTYRLLIDTKGQSNDVAGMEQVVETMKADGIEPDSRIKAVLARHYVRAGLKEKAKSILEEMEGSELKVNRGVCSWLLPLYADLGSVEDVERIWKACESSPRVEECIAAIGAYGRLKKIDEAEEVFEKMLKKWERLTSKQYSTLLKVYADNKLLSKGKDLVKRMAENDCRIGPLTWDALVKLYVGAGEVEKADSLLHKVAHQNNVKPMFSSYMTILDSYARKGDIHNAEKIFHQMRQVGYVSRLRQYHSLLQTYINANVPAYGFRERMKADNVFPNKGLQIQLAQVDAFRKKAVSDLLEWV